MDIRWLPHRPQQMFVHCLGHEIVHALLNACCSRRDKMSQCEGHSTAFENLSGNIFGHPDVPGNAKGQGGGWCDITEPMTIRGSWAKNMKKIPVLRL